MSSLNNDEISKQYARVAENNNTDCCNMPTASAETLSQKIGYSDTDIAAVPVGANMGLGCGNPQAIAALKTGEVVLDLGSGGGFDCFLAAQKVGASGQVLGVDMTPEMITKARINAEQGGYQNVEFRLGEIENLPVADNSIDVVISNCVINLCKNKLQVYREIKRVLVNNGRLIISDTLGSVDVSLSSLLEPLFSPYKAEEVPCSDSTQATDNAVGRKKRPSPSGCA